MSDDTYNGHRNYATWCVSLWNDDEYYIEMVQEHCADVISELSDIMRADFEEYQPVCGTGVYSDLMSAMSGDIAWDDLAADIIDEVRARAEDDEYGEDTTDCDTIYECVTSSDSCQTDDIIDGVRRFVPADLLDAYDNESDNDVRYYAAEDIHDWLDDNTPEGLCWGSHPDDGACFGFWRIGVMGD